MPIDLSLILRLGTQERMLSVPDLAMVLGLDASATRAGLLAAVVRPSPPRPAAACHPPGYPQGEGDYRGRGFPSDRNGNDIQNPRSSEPFREDGGPGEEGARAVDNHATLASYLADRLDDAKSFAWYRLVASQVPRSVIDDALVRALDIPAREVRRSRAAVFTALVRNHVRARSSTSPDSSC